MSDSTASTGSDPYAWLEDVTGDKPLDWVEAAERQVRGRARRHPGFEQLEAQPARVLDSDAKIPGVEKIGDYYYNFWKDAQHERGLWRRTTLDEYRKPQPQWETVIDLDALNKAEGENWVWHGADCLQARTYAALPGRAVARRRRRRRHPRVRPGHQDTGSRTASSAPKPRAGWAGSTATRSTSTPISAPAR